MSTTESVREPSAASPTGGPAAGRTTGRVLAWLLTVAGAIGLIASFVLTLEKIELLKDPSYVPTCSINPIISCGSVMRTEQAEAFGFSNTLLGIAAFAVVAAVGAAMLAGARFRRWYWLGMQAGVLFGIGFVHWLIVNSLYEIGALCPYCMVVWAVTIVLFWYVTLHNLSTGVIPLPAGWDGAVRALREFHWVVPVVWYLVIVILIGFRFWFYWKTLL
jgi:uncharacterized membrane protein